MGRIDFFCDWKGTEEETIKEILRHILITPIKYDFPNVVLVTGKSGHGKSESMLNIEEILLNEKGLKLEDFVNDIVIMNPLEYSEKINPLLTDDRLKKVFLIHIDDARMVVGAENWASFVNVAISHVNALSRSIKPLILFVLTQSIKDIDPKTRRTIDWEFHCQRSRFDYVKITPFKYWMDEHDIEKPKLRRRRVLGLINENGQKTKVLPIIKLKRYKNETVLTSYRKLMLEGKKKFLDKILTNLTEKIKKDLSVGDFQRVNEMAEHFRKNPDYINEYGEFKRKKWRLNENGVKMLKFSHTEKREFEAIVNSGFTEAIEK